MVTQKSLFYTVMNSFCCSDLATRPRLFYVTFLTLLLYSFITVNQAVCRSDVLLLKITSIGRFYIHFYITLYTLNKRTTQLKELQMFLLILFMQ